MGEDYRSTRFLQYKSVLKHSGLLRPTLLGGSTSNGYVPIREERSDDYAGVYIWDSVESMMRFRSSDLAASIPAAYRVTKPPEIEIHEVVFTLRQ